MWPHDIFPEPQGLSLRYGMAGVARTDAPAVTAAATSRVSGLATDSVLSAGCLGKQSFCFQDYLVLGGSRAGWRWSSMELVPLCMVKKRNNVNK